MKGNGRILAFFLILLVLIGLVVLNVTLFTIKEITVLEKVDSDLIVTDSIVKSSNIQIGNNIFALSEKKAIKNIELANPYVSVTSIERKFPNKVIIHATVRVPVMTVGIADSVNYALLDANLKILEIIDPYSNTYKASTKIIGILVESPVVGSVLNTNNNPLNLALAAISNVADNENLSEVAFLTFFDSIRFFDTENNNIYIKINSGVTFVLSNNQNLDIQLRYCLEKYRFANELSQERKKGYYFFDTDEGWSWQETNPNN